MKIGDDARYISSLGTGKSIPIHYSKILAVDKKEKTVELENGMKLKFLHKSEEKWSPWVTFRDMKTGKTVLIDGYR